MGIRVVCQSCQAKLNVKDECAGKQGKCPKCGSVLKVPEAEEDAQRNANAGRNTHPTAPQIEYARDLAIQFEPNISRRDLSRLIDGAVEARDNEQLKVLDQIQDRESEAYRQIREQVEQEHPSRAKATPGDMAQELADRDLIAIVITFPLDDLDGLLDGETGAKLDIEYSNDWLTGDDMRRVLGRLGLQLFASENADDDDGE